MNKKADLLISTGAYALNSRKAEVRTQRLDGLAVPEEFENPSRVTAPTHIPSF